MKEGMTRVAQSMPELLGPEIYLSCPISKRARDLSSATSQSLLYTGPYLENAGCTEISGAGTFPNPWSAPSRARPGEDSQNNRWQAALGGDELAVIRNTHTEA
jgi:hypothetical protein